MTRLAPVLSRCREIAGNARFPAYFGISGLCLGLDYSFFLLLAALQIEVVVAGSVSYASGLVFHFLLSRNFLFNEMARARSIGIALAQYGLTGAFGTGVTAATLWYATRWSFSGPEAKAIACVLSFLSVYALRSRLFFAPQAA